MIKEEVGDEVLHALLISTHDTDYLMQKPDGTKYILQIRKGTKTIFKYDS
tara:strand:+ start:98 stop:247 length:150 start_codon:yes stop_codon:yes gene_type:complete